MDRTFERRGDADTLELESRAWPDGSWLLEVGPHCQTVRLDPGKSITLGSGTGVNVRVKDPTVSATHCRVSIQRPGLVVRDLGSKNGLFVGGARVAEALLSASGAGFAIGRTNVLVRRCTEANRCNRSHPVPGLVGDSASMRRVRREIYEVARCRAPVLIHGESGTGKDVVARAIHEISGRVGAYVPVNAAAFPDTLADSELFGHCRGAFTGAVANRSGAFTEANQGTLFLDEVAELSAAVQVRLLRVVEDGRVRPLGSAKEMQTEVRIVSATWADLDDCIERRTFRADLYHRLATLTLELPPLRKRKDDIPLLARALLTRFAAELGHKTLSNAAVERLLEYEWPGNVRELSGVLYRAGLCAQSPSIEPDHLTLGRTASSRRRVAVSLTPSEARELYERHGRNSSAAARAARVARSTFRGWLEKDRRPRA